MHWRPEQIYLWVPFAVPPVLPVPVLAPFLASVRLEPDVPLPFLEVLEAVLPLTGAFFPSTAGFLITGLRGARRLLRAATRALTIDAYSSKPFARGPPTFPPSTRKMSQSIASSNRPSWEATMTPPPYSFAANASASIVSRSRWFVGSSRSSTCGDLARHRASASRAFCPPDSAPAGTSAVFPEIPNPPRNCLYSSSFSPGVSRIMCSTEFSCGVRSSMACCANRPTRSDGWRCTAPSVGSQSPAMTRRSDDLPLPFEPTSPMRLSANTSMSTAEKSFVRTGALTEAAGALLTLAGAACCADTADCGDG
eukprot:Opistho-2@34417